MTWEGGYVCATGIGLGLAVTAVTLVATTTAQRVVAPHAQPALPFGTIAAVAAGCVALVLATSLLTGAAA